MDQDWVFIIKKKYRINRGGSHSYFTYSIPRYRKNSFRESIYGMIKKRF